MELLDQRVRRQGDEQGMFAGTRADYQDSHAQSLTYNRAGPSGLA